MQRPTYCEGIGNMLSRIARGLYQMGRSIERAQNMVRILEVNHKMDLEREPLGAASGWVAIAESIPIEAPATTEAVLYAELVLSDVHPFSVRQCISAARNHGRSMRDHVSEEMWLHLNRYYLDLRELDFGDILRVGRSEFNRQVETFCDAFHGLADNTMVRGPAWAFLRAGKFLERAEMCCRILDIKRKTLELVPHAEGHPLDVHQWQALLRSLSAYEPYRRVYQARIQPERVLEFVLKSDAFPRSLAHSLVQFAGSLRLVSASGRAQGELQHRVDGLLQKLHQTDPLTVLGEGRLHQEVIYWLEYCDELALALDETYFSNLRPAVSAAHSWQTTLQAPQ